MRGNKKKERSIDEYLGFAQETADKADPAPPSDELSNDGTYEDSWYQVLKSRVGEDGGDDEGNETDEA